VDNRVTNRLGALFGVIAVVGNVVGVAVLGDVPSAYRPGAMASWVSEVVAAPGAVAISAVAFTVGLLALAGWALILGARLNTPLARAAGAVIAAGAVLDAAGTPAPLVLALHVGPLCGAGHDCLPAGAALLGMSLAADALFNLLLGIGLVLLAAVMWRRGFAWRSLAVLMLVAGLASVPVSLQVAYDAAAKLLVVAGPLWLSAIAVTSVRLWRAGSAGAGIGEGR